uniref:LIM zinc-binding domain-containing protein n=1 Tax=Plectus sambesii TaxID=2011161 RepID=A0A914V1N0_9BILA
MPLAYVGSQWSDSSLCLPIECVVDPEDDARERKLSALMMFLTTLDEPFEPHQQLVTTSMLGSATTPEGPCRGCGFPIMDRFFLLVGDRCWHVDCLKCCLCQIRLDQADSCFMKDGMVFCRDDYHRQFSKRCKRCHRPLSNQDVIMKARECVYHIQCFNCIICGSSLQPGELFALGDNGSLYCQGII